MLTFSLEADATASAIISATARATVSVIFDGASALVSSISTSSSSPEQTSSPPHRSSVIGPIIGGVVGGLVVLVVAISVIVAFFQRRRQKATTAQADEPAPYYAAKILPLNEEVHELPSESSDLITQSVTDRKMSDVEQVHELHGSDSVTKIP
jgi:hypothetical protein